MMVAGSQHCHDDAISSPQRAANRVANGLLGPPAHRTRNHLTDYLVDELHTFSTQPPWLPRAVAWWWRGGRGLPCLAPP